VPIAEHEDDVRCLLLSENQDTLLAGDETSSITQYHKTRSQKWVKQTQYSDLEIGWVQSLARIGNLFFAGGLDSKMLVINITDKEVLPGTIETAVRYIYSLKIFRVSEFHLYLAVNGERTSYFDNKTDLFDVSKTCETKVISNIFEDSETQIELISNQFSVYYDDDNYEKQVLKEKVDKKYNKKCKEMQRDLKTFDQW
jgi:hypothetical protein